MPESQVCVPNDVAETLPPIARGATTMINQFGYGAATFDVAAGTPLSDLLSFTYYANSPAKAESESAISMARLISGEYACLAAAGAGDGDDSLNAGGALEVLYTLASERSYVTIATPIVVYLAVTRIPTSVVPGSDQYDFGALGIAAWLPALTNLAVLACIAAIAIALTGRLAGTIITLTAYPALFWLGANTNTPSPYTAFCSTDTNPPAWIATAAFLAATIAVLTATGGTTVLSRRLDARHSG